MQRFCFIAPGYRAFRVMHGDTSGSGGAESQMAFIAAALARSGMTVEMIFGNGASHPAEFNVNGVRCIQAYPNWRRPISVWRFFRTLQQSGPAYYYANLPDDFLPAVRLARRVSRRSRYIYALANDVHCNPWATFRYRSWFHNPLYAWGLKSADYVTIQHQRQRSAVEPYVSGKIFAAPNLLQVIRSSPRSFEETTIDAIWVALIRPQKQLDILLNLAERLSHLKFAVIGGFDERTLEMSSIKNLRERLATLPNVRYYGALTHDDLLPLLQLSKVSLSTSSFEGFPNTMLEAWGAGVPVLSLTVDPGGVITRESMGIVSETFEQMAGDLERLTSEGNLNARLGRNGHAYVRREHSFEAFCKALASATLDRDLDALARPSSVAAIDVKTQIE